MIHIHIILSKYVELHRKLTILGMILLVCTFALNNSYTENQFQNEFNFAYITGIAMLIVFLASFIIFNKEKLKDPKN